MTARWHAQWAWLPGAEMPVADVLIEAVDGRFVAVTPGVPAPDAATRLPGLTLPGLANAHSHAFHRALRGRTSGDRGSFWTWRNRMYTLAGRIDPDSYLALARASYAEMALAGITCVGEFHYLHHGEGGRPYADPNVMGKVLLEAAAQAGIRITLLDTLYLTSTVDGQPLRGVQERFGDGDLDGWVRRTEALADTDLARIGAAIHSVRAVPAELLDPFARLSDHRPLHVHLSEQRAENEACLAYYKKTPTELLADAGVLGPGTTAVHATHLTDGDRTELGDTDTGVCLCPTTERDLADGIGPARALADAGCPLSVGSDSQAVVDLFEEARAVELDERLASEHRGHFSPAELVRMATNHRSLGWDDAGVIAPGARADLVTVRLDSPRTAGTAPRGALFAATAADVATVFVDGHPVVRDGHHVRVDVPVEMARAVAALW
jgi:formiminoglutamate deiminase